MKGCIWVYLYHVCMYLGQYAHLVSSFTDLGNPLGVADTTKIQWYQITASSHVQGYGSQKGRLNRANGYWSAANESTPWIQVDLSNAVTITAIQTQGAGYDDAWVTELQVQTGDSEDTLSNITDARGHVVSLY